MIVYWFRTGARTSSIIQLIWRVTHNHIKSHFGKDNRLRIITHRLQSECVTSDDICLKNESDCISILILYILLEKATVFLVEEFKEPFAAFLNIIFPNVNTVDRGNCENRISLIVQLALFVARFNDM